MSSGRLAGKVALVTGGSRGQGEAIGAALVNQGASVVLADVLDDAGEQVAKGLGERCRYVHLDVTDEGQWAEAVNETSEHFGPLNVLVNNAGILVMGTLESLDLDAVDLGPDGIRVNSLHPGTIDTPMIHFHDDDADGDEMRRAHAAGLPLRRLGTVEDMTGIVVFLASDESSYCTGAEFIVDGGATCAARR
jgi:NAD(P)-dependent dehydrogenase (short-subunit alcohol dehydrogenase family)